MGFGPFSSESSTNTTTTTQNAGFSETGGAAISLNLTGGGKRSTVNPTVNILDGGAVKLGFETANAALDANKYGLDAALDFANVSGQRATESSLDAIKSALDFSASAFSDAIHTTQDALRNVSANAADSLASVQQLATRNSATESDKISKLAGYALLAIAALVIVPKVFAK